MIYLVTGGCGFIGSHVVRRLLADPTTAEVRIVDNLASGSKEHLGAAVSDPRLSLHVADLKDAEGLKVWAEGVDHAFHFAANPDIAKAMTDPTVDFVEGTLLTQNVLEACRKAEVGRLTYASGSGVYGDESDQSPSEDFGPLIPVSTYGASKLGCEALISAYCHMFGLAATAFRFANVVGDGQTHGVTYDFVRKLAANPKRLEVLGDGTQEKAYVHVDDVVAAMMVALPGVAGSFRAYNVGTEDTLTVRRIAEVTIDEMGLSDVEVLFGSGARGWRGDVPVVRLNYERIHSTGWRARLTSEEAIRSSIKSNIAEVQAGGK